MARVKNTSTNISRRIVAIPLMLLSIILVASAVISLLSLRSEGVGIFQSRLDVITNEFEETETIYGNTVTSILSKRVPVSDFVIETLQNDYDQIQVELAQLETEITEANTSELLSLLNQRKSDLGTLRIVNTALRVEERIGNSLLAYNQCKKNISYRAKASQILVKLEECKKELQNALTTLEELPKETYATCSLKETPTYYLQRTLKSHEYFVSSYAYTSKSKAKEAAAMDLEYQKVLNEIQSLPDWNTCISDYLLITSAELLE